MTSPSLPSFPEVESPASAPLEALVSHLVAAKRSLSSIEHVWRANEIVTSTRAFLESSVVTSARTSFLRAGISAQVQTLEQVHHHSEAVELEGAEEYQDVVRTLDEADQRLKGTLARLRTTMIEAGLRPEADQRKSLLDFVDESGVDDLLISVQEAADAAQKAHADLVETNSDFWTDLEHIGTLLHISFTTDKASAPALHDGPLLSPIPDMLESMEDRAKDMANNLESLVKHFDLCVTAIKHTEGGGEAAQRLADDLPVGVDVGEELKGAPPEQVSEQERREMLEVLAKDADQVEEVVMEIRDHIAEMEGQFSTVSAYLDEVAREHSDIKTAFKLLDNLGSRLQGFLGQSEVFVMRWDDEKVRINERMEELKNLGDFYDGYLNAYDNLLVEIGRRQFMEQQMDKVLQDAMRKLETLYDEDNAKRETFKSNHGDFLPVDIWPGLTDPPLHFEARPKNGADKVPDISKSVIQRAIRRVEGKSVS
ncbi:MAG: hypothetical protein LQ350_002130 [Teloschistes chrysophthalmus]|nr:MAG: hypothetical protein LQ350_002130 [Niorma chrysophthalma]